MKTAFTYANKIYNAYYRVIDENQVFSEEEAGRIFREAIIDNRGDVDKAKSQAELIHGNIEIYTIEIL